MLSSKKMSISIFMLIVSTLSIVSGYEYTGDIVEKSAYGVTVFHGYFILVALFGIYREQPLFSYKQLLIIAYSSLVITLVNYLYPLFKYWEQDASSLSSAFIYDLIINIVIFSLLFKEAKNGRS